MYILYIYTHAAAGTDTLTTRHTYHESIALATLDVYDVSGRVFKYHTLPRL